MRLPVYLYGHPVLRAENVEISPDFPDLKQLVADMYTANKVSEGVGLAAPQIGKNIRLVIIDADPVGDTFPECKGRRFALINPKVEILDGEPVKRTEGCLSIPGISESVPRVEHIRLSWLDEDFQPHTEELSGYLARIVQHECDHLEGILYIDHISAIRKQLIRGKLRAIAEGRAAVDYPAKYAPGAKRR